MQETIRLDPCIPPIPRCNSTAITARLSRMFGPDDAHPSQPSLAPPVSGFFALIAFQPHVLRFLSKLMTARPSTVSPSTIPAAERTSGGMKIPSGVKPSPFLTSTSALNDFSTPEAGDRDVGRPTTTVYGALFGHDNAPCEQQRPGQLRHRQRTVQAGAFRRRLWLR